MRNVKDLYMSLIFFTIIVINGISAEKRRNTHPNKKEKIKET